MITRYQKIDFGERTIFQRVQFKPPLRALELMDSEACLLYSLTGESSIYGTTASADLSSGEGLLMKCGNFISHHQPVDHDTESEAVTIHFFPDVLRQVFDNDIPSYLTSSINKDQKILHKIESSEILKSYILSLLIYFDNPAIASPDAIKLKIKEVIGLLYHLDSHGVREILSDLFNPQQVEFKHVIQAHLYDNLSLDDYADILSLSVSSFRRKFRAIYGMAPGQYMMDKKLQKAADLLATTRLRVSEICYDVGFGDGSNFSKHFSRRYGMSPSEYRLSTQG